MRHAHSCAVRPAAARWGHDFDRLFAEFFGPASEPVQTVGPAVNVWEHDDRYELEAELPGYKIEDLEITVEGMDVRLAGKRTASDQPENATVLRRERNAQSFARQVAFPVELDAEKASAKLQHGVLTLTLPKAAAVLPRKVQVQAG